MMPVKLLPIFFLAVFFVLHTTVAQDQIIVNEIKLEGNKRTKDHIILRELDFKKGDTLTLTNTVFQKDSNRIFNTGLFITVAISTSPADVIASERGAIPKHVVSVTVKERWYIWPTPIIEPADRNFNEWWKDRNLDPERVELGIRITDKNFRGRKEELKTKIQFGFTKKYELFYTIPYIDKKMRTGMRFGVSFSQNRQTAYVTDSNDQDFIKSDKFLKKRFYLAAQLFNRKKFYNTHALQVRFHHNTVADTIAALNPDYFLDGKTQQNYFVLSYQFVRDFRNIQFYPTKGYRFDFTFNKLGLWAFNDLDLWEFRSSYAHFLPVSNRFFYAGKISGKFSNPQKQPYFNIQALGYDQDFIRGYETNVIDGHSFILNRNEFKFLVFNTIKEAKKIVPARQFNTVPVSIYVKIHSDIGYVAAKNVALSNKALTNTLLWGGGAGIDIVTFYDLVWRIEYSVDKDFNGGVFFHVKAAI